MTDNEYLTNPMGIDKCTGELTDILKACKSNKYLCPECKGALTIKWGKIKQKHFSHQSKGNCTYTRGGEGIIHKNCKMFLCEYLNNGGTIKLSLEK